MSEIDDQRMKDLADRMVAMSPEPPPFPEEVTVTQPNSSKRSPVLVFAGAAAVVLILAAIPLLIMRGGGEVDPVATTTTSSVPSTESTDPGVTSTTQAETTTTIGTTTSPVTESRNVIVYMVQSPENSLTGNPAVVPFFATAEALPSDSAELAALRLLTADGLVLPEGFETMIPDPVEVVGFTRSEHMVVVDMNEAFVDGAGGLLADFTMLNQLIFTAAGSEEITELLFTVGGEPVTAFGTDGLDLTEPLGRDSFLDQLNSVIVDSAPTGTGDGPLTMTGFANVFEATVSLELVDLNGNVVYEDFANATCGTGCWGGLQLPYRRLRLRGHPGDHEGLLALARRRGARRCGLDPRCWGDEAVWNFLPGR